MVSSAPQIILVAFLLPAAACGEERKTTPVPPAVPPRVVVALPDTAIPLQFISDQETALRIGEAVLVRRYGRAQIDAEKPLKASLQRGVWTVTGTLPPNHVGGVAVVELDQRDARVLRMVHEL